MSTNKHVPINYDLSSIPVLDENSSLKKCLDLMTKLGKGIAVLVDKSYTVKGVLTDGDLRRLLLTHQNPLPSLLISEGIIFGNSQPVVFLENTKPEEIIKIFRNRHISQILIIDTNRRLIGYVNGYDLIKSE
jgi:arabinose-5-phosphate isomerase